MLPDSRLYHRVSISKHFCSRKTSQKRSETISCQLNLSSEKNNETKLLRDFTEGHWWFFFLSGKNYLLKVSVWVELRSGREIVIKQPERVGGSDNSNNREVTWCLCVFASLSVSSNSSLLLLWSLCSANAKCLGIVSSLLLSLLLSLLHLHYSIL